MPSFCSSFMFIHIHFRAGACDGSAITSTQTPASASIHWKPASSASESAPTQSCSAATGTTGSVCTHGSRPKTRARCAGRGSRWLWSIGWSEYFCVLLYLGDRKRCPMMCRVAVLLLLFINNLATAALPPGYEEELYCPPDMCLKKRNQPPGWSGPRSAFHECCDEAKGLTARPHSWGVKVDKGVKVELIRNHWHLTQCTQQRGVCGRQAGVWRVLERVDTFFETIY